MADIKDDGKTEEERKKELEKEEQERKEEEKKREALSEIEAQAKSLSDKYGEKFDVGAYTAAAKSYVDEHKSLEGFDSSAFIKEKDDEDKGKDKDKESDNEKIENNKALSFSLKEKDGKFTAIGTDGTVLEGKNFEEINDKICQDLKQKVENEGRECVLAYRGKNPERQEIFSRNAIMKHGVAISDGYPKDPQFWKDLKNEYLADKNHSLKEWERMTRKIPDDVMQRTPEEQARNKKLLDADLLKKLRKGMTANEAVGATAGIPPTPTIPLSIDQTNGRANNVSGMTNVPNTPVANNIPNISNVSNEAGTVGQPTGEQVGDQKAQDRNLVAQMRRGINPNSPEYQAQMAAEEQRRQNTQELTPEMQEEIKKRAQDKIK